jgi:hypothetical protein
MRIRTLASGWLNGDDNRHCSPARAGPRHGNKNAPAARTGTKSTNSPQI